nr:MAG TPA: hypothetical protein [Caudoviricetes sp.]
MKLRIIAIEVTLKIIKHFNIFARQCNINIRRNLKHKTR